MVLNHFFFSFCGNIQYCATLSPIMKQSKDPLSSEQVLQFFGFAVVMSVCTWEILKSNNVIQLAVDYLQPNYLRGLDYIQEALSLLVVWEYQRLERKI